MTEQKFYDNVSVEKKEKSQIEITGEVPNEQVVQFRTRALKKVGKTTEIDGFRKGRVPENILVQRVGESTIMQETAELALSEVYPKLIKEHGLAVIGQPAVSITKLAAGNPIGFKILAAVLPEIVLPDYKQLAKTQTPSKSEDLEVSDKEFEEALMHAKRHQAQYTAAKQKTHSTPSNTSGQESLGQAENKVGDGGSSGLLGPDGKPLTSERGNNTPTEEKLPELTDEFVKLLGEYKSVDDFKIQLRENLRNNKERRAHEKKRVELSEKLIQATVADIPELLREHELDRMLAQFTADIARMGMSPEQYYEKAKTSEKELRTKWREDAEKRAKLELILAEIAKEEHITPSDEDIDKEFEHLLTHHKDADPARVKPYIRGVLRNEKVFKFLEEQA